MLTKLINNAKIQKQSSNELLITIKKSIPEKSLLIKFFLLIIMQ